MLRLLAGLLLAANLIFFAWNQGWLSPLAAPPMSSEREPERTAMQVRPEALRLMDAQAGQRARASAEEEAAAARAAKAASAAAEATSAPPAGAAAPASRPGPR